MKIFYSVLLVAFIFQSCGPTTNSSTEVNLPPIPVKEYPTTKKDDIEDDFFGVKVADPYRWLEDDNSEETKDWVTKQNEVTFDYLNKIPFKSDIKERMTKIWNYTRYATPFKENGKYYYFKNDGLQNHSVLYVQDDLQGESTVVLDPNKFSEDGTTSLSSYSFSKNGKYFGYMKSEGGSDWKSAHIKNLETGKDIDEKLDWLKFTGLSWYKDGFFYSRYDKPKDGGKLSQKNEFHKVFYHKLGTPQSDDDLIYSDKDNPQRNFYAQTTEDEKFLILYASEGTSGNSLAFRKLEDTNGKFISIVDNFESDHTVVDSQDDKLLISTNQGAPNQRLVLVDTKNPGTEHWKDIIPESENVLKSVSVIGGKLVLTYIKDVNSYVRVMKLNGEHEYDIKLPGLGTVGSFSGKRDEDKAFYTFTSFTRPGTIYEFDIQSGKSTIFKTSEVDFNPEDYISEQVFYKSKDGTKVPMFITYKKGVKKDGTNPALLYGYGGFNVSLQPSFSISNVVLLENGGIYAVANIRGGGEYGEKWHEAGTKLQKQNVFDDFIAAAEYLIDEGYTSKEKLGIEGGSNGGLLVGACMIQRPDLFKVAFPRVGVMDMLRYHKFTIGWAWAVDYGTSDDSTQFKNLLGYSPVHNLKDGTAYPATLVTTADHDDRVVPAHSFKFISRLQEAHVGENPVLIRVETSAGHGAGKSTEMRIEERADILSFLFYNVGENVSYLKN